MALTSDPPTVGARELRNQTAHEYPLQPEIVQLNLRRLAQHVPDLEAALAQLQSHAVRRGAHPSC